MPAERRRTRLVTAAGLAAAAVALASTPAVSVALTGSAPAPARPDPGARAPMARTTWLPAPAASPAATGAAGGRPAVSPDGTAAITGRGTAGVSGRGYRAYVALAGSNAIAEVGPGSHVLAGATIPADSVQSVAVSRDGGTLYAAETGQSDVLQVTVGGSQGGSAADGTVAVRRRIAVGSFPQDLAISPDGGEVYACVAGGRTDAVAVIGTATGAVRQMIGLDAAPRAVVFSPDGSRAYVTTARSVQEINTADGRVAGTVPDPAGPQGIAVTPDGRRLLVTNPRSGEVWAISTRTGAVTARIRAGTQPWAVAAAPGPGGEAAYVTDINADTVAVINTSSRRTVRTIAVGRLPASAAVTPDGSQVWVGNDMSGTLSVISVRTGTVTATIPGGAGTAAIDAGPLGIAFGPMP